MNLTLVRYGKSGDGMQLVADKTFEFEGWAVTTQHGDFGYSFWKGGDEADNQITLTLDELYAMCDEVEELQASRAVSKCAFPATLTDEHANGACDCASKDESDFYEDDAPPADEPEDLEKPPYPISPKDIRFVIGVLEGLL